MSSLIEDLPVELVGTNVLGYLSLKDIVMLERACGSKKSHQQFCCCIPYCAAVELPYSKHNSISALIWIAKRHCRVKYLSFLFVGDNPCLHVEGLQVDYFDLHVNDSATIENLKALQNGNMGYKVRSIDIYGHQNREFMEKLSACTGNTKELIMNSKKCIDSLTVDILSRWKLSKLNLAGASITTLLLIVQTCTELTSIKLYSSTVDDAVVIAIAQLCPKLETLKLESRNLTYHSLIVLSERGLPLKELYIEDIPIFPTADIARRCSHALSCIRYLDTTYDLYENGQNANILIPYMTGLTELQIGYCCRTYIRLLTQHCHKLTKIAEYNADCNISDILSLCCAKFLLEDLHIFGYAGITDTTLIELIHACPHINTLRLYNETNITDIGILALSEHSNQLQELDIGKCHKITEAAVLQLLQRCRKLTELVVSNSSLSEETWTQLDMNTQKRVSRCK